MRIQDLVTLNVPFAVLPLLLRLAKTLVRDAPETDSELVAKTLARLKQEITRIEAALDERLRSQSPGLLARELEFDRAVDALWRLLLVCVRHRGEVYAHPGLDFLSAERQAAVDLDGLRDKAEQATRAYEALFVPGGLGFTQQAMNIQVEAMATLLRLIESDGHGQAVTAALGSEFLTLLKTCQAEYGELVHVRMRREVRVVDDFRILSAELRWRMDRYKAAVESLYDEDEPDSLDPVVDALRGLIVTAKVLSRSASSSEAIDGELDEVLVELESDLEPEPDLEPEVQVEAESEPEPANGF